MLPRCWPQVSEWGKLFVKCKSGSAASMEQFQALVDWLDAEITNLSDQWLFMAEGLARHLAELLPSKPEVRLQRIAPNC